jgi:hypothetical protein
MMTVLTPASIYAISIVQFTTRVHHFLLTTALWVHIFLVESKDLAPDVILQRTSNLYRQNMAMYCGGDNRVVYIEHASSDNILATGKDTTSRYGSDPLGGPLYRNVERTGSGDGGGESGVAGLGGRGSAMEMVALDSPPNTRNL